MNTVGKKGQPGADVRCVVSVSMLTEGWDANNVTHILGLRAFGSQLLCEQVVGRGLRRMNYDPDPETGLLPEEYVDVYGIPFSLIPYKGKGSNTPPDRPVNRIRARPERAQYEIRYPNVEGYVYSLSRNLIRADVDAMERLDVEPHREPTATFVRASVGYATGTASGKGLGDFVAQDRSAYYAETHPQQILFEVARQIVGDLVGEGDHAPVSGAPKLRGYARHQLFPQVLRLVERYVGTKVDYHGADPRELGLDRYVVRIRERMVAAIEPDAPSGETPMLPLLNRFRPIGTTADVDYATKRPVHATVRSHVDQVILDSSWEQTVAFYLEDSSRVAFYVRNAPAFLTIPYTHDKVARNYEPDYIVRLGDGRSLILEVKGERNDEENAKHEAAKRWCRAVTHWGQLGEWSFLECRDPQDLPKLLQEV